MSGSDLFPLFSLLPAEIRLEIWQYSCCHPRVVEVYYDAANDLCTTNSSQPAALHACAESRREALRFYKPLFGTTSHEAGIYFNPELDTLYIPRPPYMGYDDNSRDFAELCTGAPEVVNLALDHVNPVIRRPWETYNKYTLMQSFPKVMEVYLVLDSSNPSTPKPVEEHDKAKHGFLRLAEPTRDENEICKLLHDVKMSFAYEVGADFANDAKDEADGMIHAPALILKSKVETNYLRLL